MRIFSEILRITLETILLYNSEINSNLIILFLFSINFIRIFVICQQKHGKKTEHIYENSCKNRTNVLQYRKREKDGVEMEEQYKKIIIEMITNTHDVAFLKRVYTILFMHIHMNEKRP